MDETPKSLIPLLYRFGLVGFAAFLGAMLPAFILPSLGLLIGLPALVAVSCVLPVFGVLAWRFGWRGGGAFVAGGVAAGFLSLAILSVIISTQQAPLIAELDSITRFLTVAALVSPVWILLGVSGGYSAHLAWTLSEEHSGKVAITSLAVVGLFGLRVVFDWLVASF